MNNIELLAPAGSFEALVAAIQNGANAVYIGGSSFSARAFATNFDDQEIIRAIEYAHTHFAKIYVTVNTLYYDEEIDDLLEYIAFLYHQNCDAIIIQDIGLFDLIKGRIPGMEIHISTQMSVNNLDSVRFFEQYGVERVVLARENTIEEIQEIAANTSVDLEVFVHGAICVSYSGQCLMSSNIAKRSGNRGSCGQPCRLGYELIKDGEAISENAYLLSPKDLCTIENIGQLIDANVKSFKIEGRMKRPEYVATVVAAYRKAIDNHLAHKYESLDQEILKMKKMFNRGFSQGYLFNDESKMEPDFPGNQGINVGEVVGYNRKTRKVAIRLSETLHQNDRVEFLDILLKRTITKLYLDGYLVNHAEAGEVVEIELDHPVKVATKVNKIYDVELIKEANRSYQKENVANELNLKFEAHIGGYPVLFYRIGAYQGMVSQGFVVEKARNRPVTPADIHKQLAKLGNTPFGLGKLEIEIDNNISMPLKILNQLRREAIEALNNQLTAKRSVIDLKAQWPESNSHVLEGLMVKVTTLQQAQAALKHTSKIAYPLDQTVFEMFELAQTCNVELALYTTYRYESDLIEKVKAHPYYSQIMEIFVGDYQSCTSFKDKKLIIDSNMNVVNSFAASFFPEATINLSTEMSRKQINRLKTTNELMFEVYGRSVNMTTRHCVISQHYFGKKVAGCNRCKSGNFALKDRMGEHFPIGTNELCDNIIYHNKPTLISDIASLKVDRILLHFTIETVSEIEQIINYYLNLLNNKPVEELNFSNYVKLYYND